MADVSRRDFLKSTLGASVAVTAGTLPMAAQAGKRSATDWVTLGNSGVKVTRLALGTGTFGGKIQRSLGQEEFTRLVRYAWERGIRFFESADAYSGMHEMLGKALEGIPRDSYRLMTKMRWRQQEDAAGTIDRFRRELKTEYFDILLLHCVRTPGWPQELERLRDALSEAKQKKVILAHGASCHGLLPLRDFPGNQWLDVALLRINHDGTRMDTIQTESNEKGNVAEVTERMRAINAQGTGVIGMKLIGEGRFTAPEERDASLKFAMKLGTVNAVTIGFKSTAEIDEAIERINRHLNA